MDSDLQNRQVYGCRAADSAVKFRSFKITCEAGFMRSLLNPAPLQGNDSEKFTQKRLHIDFTCVCPSHHWSTLSRLNHRARGNKSSRHENHQRHLAESLHLLQNPLTALVVCTKGMRLRRSSLSNHMTTNRTRVVNNRCHI